MGFQKTNEVQPDRAGASILMGDSRWAARNAVPLESDVAMDWPEDVLLSFSLRMAGHGMSVSRTMMICDRRYAMQQLVFAHSLQDTRLQKLAAQLMFYFEDQQARQGALH